MHPGFGPTLEAETLYIRQLKVRERMQQQADEFVVWDVGLGAGANPLTLLRQTRDLSCPLRILSFDNTSGPLEFALGHADQLPYFHDYQNTVRDLLKQKRIEFSDGRRGVTWEFQLGDFPKWCAPGSTRRSTSAPDAVFFDAFSPAKNPSMWTLPLFENLFKLLNPARPCSLTTYSRSTMFRVTLLLAGFFAGRGIPTGLKEETTVAANTFSLLDDPLDRAWLERVQRSDSAEPLIEATYRRGPLSAENWARLQAHPQFA